MENEEKNVLFRIIFAAVLMVISCFLPISGLWKAAVFLLPYLIIGWNVIFEAVKNILHGRVFDETFLMTVATVGAFVLGEYAEGVAVMLFYQVGELFQSLAVSKSRRSIASLVDLRPKTAAVLRNGEVIPVPIEKVAVGQTLLLRPGDKVPLDGIVTKGTTSVNTAALTGESLPRDLKVGDAILSGSVNLSGLVEMRTTEVMEESTVARILKLIETAAERKSHVEGFMTKFAKVYTPCVVIGAFLLGVIPPLFLGNWSEWIRRALIILVVSCPCALVISVPLSFFAGIGGASRKGVLIKGPEYLEIMAKLRTVVFDKTGTLTKGSFSVKEVRPIGISEETLLTIAAAAESASTHPIAVSIQNASKQKPDKATFKALIEHPGLGIEAQLDEKKYFVGNWRLMERAGIACQAPQLGETVVHVAEDGHYLGCILIADELKEDAVEAIARLHKLGIQKTVMLTGDSKEIAEHVAAHLHISQVFSELLPSDKVSQLENLLSENEKVAFVGDGMNDAPVLMRADVGIAMGAFGSDAAIEAADVVMMDDTLSKLPTALRIARKTMRIVRQNVSFAFAVKLIILLLSAANVFHVYGMWIAVFADVGVMVLAVLNTLRAFFVKT